VTGRAPRVAAWAVSGLAHLGAAALVLRAPGSPPPAVPPHVRLAWVEPAPPPPPPIGVPGGTGGSVAAAPSAERPVEPPAPDRPRALPRRDAPRPRPVRPPAPAPSNRDDLPAAGTAAGTPSGVPGGITGGVPGGTVGGQGHGLPRAGQVANPPVVERRVVPDYPRRARAEGVHGLVLLEAILGCDGRIEDDVRVLRSVPLLDDAAIAALRQWRFRPARDGNREAVRVVVEVPIRFVLH
jgi:protein TonB